MSRSSRSAEICDAARARREVSREDVSKTRSFLPHIRHEYSRRLLCQLIGRDAANSQLPYDIQLLAPLVRTICYENAKNYFELEPGAL